MAKKGNYNKQLCCVKESIFNFSTKQTLRARPSQAQVQLTVWLFLNKMQNIKHKICNPFQRENNGRNLEEWKDWGGQGMGPATLDWCLGDAKSRGTFWQIYCILARRQKQPKIARGDETGAQLSALPRYPQKDPHAHHFHFHFHFPFS